MTDSPANRLTGLASLRHRLELQIWAASQLGYSETGDLEIDQKQLQLKSAIGVAKHVMASTDKDELADQIDYLCTLHEEARIAVNEWANRQAAIYRRNKADAIEHDKQRVPQRSWWRRVIAWVFRR